MSNVQIKNENAIKLLLPRISKTAASLDIGDDVCHTLLLYSLEISGFETIDQKSTMIQCALQRFRKYKKHDMHYFKRAIDSEVAARKKILHKPFYSLFFLNLDRVTGQSVIELCDLKMEFEDWNSVQTRFEIDKLKREAILYSEFVKNGKAFDTSYFQPVIIQTYGFSSFDAFQKAADVFETYRGIWNFCNNFNRYTIHYGHPAHVNQCLPSPIYGVFSNNGEYAPLLYEIELFKYKNRVKKERGFEINLFNKFLSAFRHRPSKGTVDHLLKESIVRYGKALDGLNRESSYLKLWQICEILGGGSEQSKFEEIKKRLLSYFKDKKLWSLVIDAACDMRNKLVHRGDYPNEDMEQLRMLKYLTEQIIYELSKIGITLKQELEIFQKYESRPHSELNAMRSIIDKITGPHASE